MKTGILIEGLSKDLLLKLVNNIHPHAVGGGLHYLYRTSGVFFEEFPVSGFRERYGFLFFFGRPFDHETGTDIAKRNHDL